MKHVKLDAHMHTYTCESLQIIWLWQQGAVIQQYMLIVVGRYRIMAVSQRDAEIMTKTF